MRQQEEAGGALWIRGKSRRNGLYTTLALLISCAGAPYQDPLPPPPPLPDAGPQIQDAGPPPDPLILAAITFSYSEESGRCPNISVNLFTCRVTKEMRLSTFNAIKAQYAGCTITGTSMVCPNCTHVGEMCWYGTSYQDYYWGYACPLPSGVAVSFGVCSWP